MYITFIYFKHFIYKERNLEKNTATVKQIIILKRTMVKLSKIKQVKAHAK